MTEDVLLLVIHVHRDILALLHVMLGLGLAAVMTTQFLQNGDNTQGLFRPEMESRLERGLTPVKVEADHILVRHSLLKTLEVEAGAEVLLGVQAKTKAGVHILKTIPRSRTERDLLVSKVQTVWYYCVSSLINSCFWETT